MGSHLSFVRTRPNHWGREDPEQGQDVGRAYFSGFTAEGQQRAYGLSWHDCVITSDEEVVDDQEFWQPNWIVALERAKKLLHCAQTTTNEHRHAYDLRSDTVPSLVAAIEFCARPENAAKCFVRVS